VILLDTRAELEVLGFGARQEPTILRALKVISMPLRAPQIDELLVLPAERLDLAIAACRASTSSPSPGSTARMIRLSAETRDFLVERTESGTGEPQRTSVEHEPGTANPERGTENHELRTVNQN
jgi:hypothetical protein